MKKNTIICKAPPKPNFVGEEQYCLHCDGCGIVFNKVCKVCHGHGVVRVNEFGSNAYSPNEEQASAARKLGGFA